MKRIFLAAVTLIASICTKAQLVLNEVSQGTSGNKEYIELVVIGTPTCSDSTADLRGWIVDDNGGWFGTSAISPGCYRFTNNANWAAVPYGSVILLYNSGDKNLLITQADDVTDANNDRVYIVPINSIYIELNPALPNAASGSTFSYPTTGFGASTTWTNLALNNAGDAVALVSPANLTAAFHSLTYGNLSGGTVQMTGSGGQTVYYAIGSQYALTANWATGAAPANETPGAPNTAANAAWIASMQSAGSGSSNDTVNAAICLGQSYAFNGASYSVAGQYTFTFSLGGGCDSIVTLNLSVTPVPPAPIVSSPVTYCQGETAAPLTATGANLLWHLTATGGTGSPVPPTPGTTASGTTIFYVSQTVNGCESPRTALQVIIIARPAAPVVATPVTYCQGATSGPLTAIGQNLLWYTTDAGGVGSPVIPVPNTATPVITALYVSQTVNGCESDRAQINITVSEIVAAFLPDKDTVCSRDTLRVTNQSSGAGLTYVWLWGDGGKDSLENPVHVYSQSGLYTVTLITTTANGCRDTFTRRVFVLPYPLLRFVNPDSVLCEGQAIRPALTVTPFYQSLVWDFGDGYTQSDNEVVQHGYDTTGTFVVSVKTVNRGCPDREFSDTIKVLPVPSIDIGPDTSLCPGAEPVMLRARLSGSGNLAAAQVTWNSGDTARAILVRHHGAYWARVSAGNQCFAADSAVIAKGCYLDIPNSFTPNGDGINDYFWPRQSLANGLVRFTMRIFNRWGQPIWETNRTDGRGWDGRYNGVAQGAGVYVYFIEAELRSGYYEKYQGNVTLLR